MYTVEYYSTIGNDILSLVGKWAELWAIVVSDMSQAQGEEPCISSLKCESSSLNIHLPVEW